MILCHKISAILLRHLYLPHLRGHRRRVLFVERSGKFGGSRSGLYAAGTVVAHAVHNRGVVDVGVVVHIANHGRVHVVGGAVVSEVVSVPVAALVSVAGVAMAVIDAAVVADVASPVAAMPAVTSAVEVPEPGCPERAFIRRRDPHPGNPVISG